MLALPLGAAAPYGTSADPPSLPESFLDGPERRRAYALDDAVETLGVAGRLAPPVFAQAQLVPFDYQATALRGAAAKIDALMLRESLRLRHAVPLPGPPAPVGGRHVALFPQGAARPTLPVARTSP